MVNYLLPQSALTINASPVINALNRMQQQRNDDRQFQQNQDRYAQETAWRQSQASTAEANNLRDYNLRARSLDADQSYRNLQLGMQKNQFGLDQKRFSEESKARQEDMKWNAVQRAAGVAQLVAGERDPQRQAAMWAQFLSSHPRVANEILPRELHLNPGAGSQFVVAKAGGYQDPLQRALTEAKTRAEIAKATGNPPAGYSWQADKTLQAIPGGPATKLGGDIAGRIALMENGLQELPRAREIFKTIGIGGRANMLLNRGQAGEARRIVQTLVEAQLRALTGAAATDPETERLMNFYGPTSTDTPKTMDNKLNRLEATIRNSIKLMRTGRSDKPETGASNASEAPVMTPEQASKLPPGAIFRTPDGRLMRVPGGGQ